MKKNKKTKKVDMPKKRKWNAFMTVASVFAGVTLVAGSTVLGVYLTGGFEEKVVLPESIDFEYDQSLFNNDQLEICVSDSYNGQRQFFNLKITTPTKDVTANEVTLSFKGQEGFNTPDEEGCISNTVIRLPQIVPIGEEFKVEILTENLREAGDGSDYVLDSNGDYIDWIKGGLSVLQASSADIMQTPKTLKIAIDVPVYKTETLIVDQNGEELEQVVSNQEFYLKSKFIPAKSQYMFSDNESGKPENEWRLKRSFFESSSSAVSPIYDDKYNMHYQVGQDASGEINIQGYTYPTANIQLHAEENLGGNTDVDFYINMRETIAGILSSDKVASKTIAIGMAEVGNYTVSRHEKNIEMEVGKELRLSLNKYDYYTNSDFLGVDVYSTSGILLDGMLKNIAIAFVDNGRDATTGTDSCITVVGSGTNFITHNGLKYYKPITSVTNQRYSYWNLMASKERDIVIKTILFVEKDSVMIPFEIGDEELSYSVNLEIKPHVEAPVSWASTSDINIMLGYDENKQVDPETIPLSSLVSIPEKNIYQDYVFFAYFGNDSKEQYKALADSVFGASGYNYEKSGVYATKNANLTLFALESDYSITLYGAGSFTLYFATVVKDQYTSEGLYQTVLFSEEGINVVCEKSLNEQSVTAGVVDTTGFTEVDGVVNIDQGTESLLSVKFTVGKESISVFEDEFRKGNVSLKILDETKKDISSLFDIDSTSLKKDAQSDDYILEYKLRVKSAYQIESEAGINLGFVSINYKDSNEQPIIREFALEEKTVCIYKPKATEIFVDPLGNFHNIFSLPIEVNQELQYNGTFKTTISTERGDGTLVEFTSVEDFLRDVLGANRGAVVITDQKGRTDTLAGQWTFKVARGDSSAITIADNGQSFVFKNTNGQNVSVVLIFESADGNVSSTEQELYFNIKSAGISYIKYADSKNPYDSSSLTISFDISKARVEKYGAKGEENQDIILSDLIKFYVDESNEYESSNYNFKINTQSISEDVLPDTKLIDLFGENGMLTLYSSDAQVVNFNEDYSPSNIRNMLASQEIYKIHINNNFASISILQFLVSDVVGAVNTLLELKFVPNVSASSESYPASGATIYAGEEISVINSVTDNNKNSSSLLTSLYTMGTKYYVVDSDGRYVLTTTDLGEGNYIATFENGKMTFVDFWDTEEQTFRVYFQPEGANSYALNHPVDFIVKRDLKIESKNIVYYLANPSYTTINDFVSITRMNNSSISGLELSYAFDEYLIENSGSIEKESETTFVFGYNEEELSSTLTISLSESGVTLAQIPIRIKLYETADLYQAIADLLQVDAAQQEKVASAQIQIVDDVKYIVLDASNNLSWSISTFHDNYTLRPQNRDAFGNSMLSFYEAVGSNQIEFYKQSSLLAGLNDSSKYLAIRIVPTGSNNTLAIVHVPVILSKIGPESVVYNNILADRKLETALMRPEELLQNSIYNEISAGQLTEILFAYTNTGDVDFPGLYNLDINKYSSVLKYYSFDNSQYKNYDNLIKGFNDNYKNISLNHLADMGEDVFLALEYIVEYEGASQTFYYLLKVNPDIKVEEVVYAYNGDAEYITGELNQQEEINLESCYDEKTLNSGYKRFNVSKIFKYEADFVEINIFSNKAKLRFKFDQEMHFVDLEEGEEFLLLNDLFESDLTSDSLIEVMIIEGEVEIVYNQTTIFKTLKFKNQIERVTDDEDNVMTNESAWTNQVELAFSEDFTTLQYRAKANNLEIKVKHTYEGSKNEKDLSVVGAEQYYTLILNASSSNYSVKFIDGESEQITTEKVVDIANSIGEKSLTIYLLNNDQAGGSQEGTIVTGKLQIQQIITEENEDDYIESYSYNSQNGSFVLSLKDYIDSDKTVSFALFIDQGFLARLTINLKSNAGFEVKTGMDQLTGGTETPFAEIFTISLNGVPTTDYTVVSGNPTGDNAGFVTWLEDGAKIQVADLIENKKVTLNFTVEFVDGKQFKFLHEFTLLANLKPRYESSGGSVVAGQEYVNLFEYTIFEDNTFYYSVVSMTCESSSPAVDISTFECFSEPREWRIKTNYVASSTVVTLNLTVFIEYGETIQQFDVIHTFTVTPSVTITANYPKPNETDKLTFEYIEDDTTYGSGEGSETNIVTNFFQETAVFAEEQRILIHNYSDKDVSAQEINIVISAMQNASLVGAKGALYALNASVPNNEGITFRKGVYDGSGYVDQGVDSYIEFTVTVREVSQTYLVYIVKNTISVNINMASKNANSGDFTEEDKTSKVNYETIYVDKTNPTSLFAEHRMAYVEMTSTMASYANEYYLVFAGEEKLSYSGYNLYASYPQSFSADDMNKGLYLDLGFSMKGKTFIGAYLTSDFEKEGISIDNSDGYLTIDEMTSILESLKDYSSSLFKNGDVTLANRIQLVYGQLNGKDILVDFSKYPMGNEYTSPLLNQLTIGSRCNFDDINKHDCFLNLMKNDGSDKYILSAKVYYYFKPTIDIDVKEKASTKGNYKEFTTLQENLNMAETFGIYHPTSGEPISASDFATGTTRISMNVLAYSSSVPGAVNSEDQEIINNYMSTYKFNEFKTQASTSDNNSIYLLATEIRNSSGHICDYGLLPLGAKNTGDFVLCQINYTVGESNDFKKTFYVVLKILPDYIVEFGENAENTIEENGIVSNANNIKQITELKGAGVYEDFTLTGENGYLSIKHSNDSNSTERSATSFTSKMETGYRDSDMIEYNNSDNLSQKIFYESENVTNLGYLLGDGSTGTICFKNVKEVIFGNQLYMIEGSDIYGFTFRLYFSLESKGDIPKVETDNITLSETDYFDVGVVYEKLTITQEQDKQEVPKYILSSESVVPVSYSNVKLINLSGIEAWAFDGDYTGDKGPLTGIGEGYEDPCENLNGYSIGNKNYLDLPQLKYLSIESIKLYDPKASADAIAELATPSTDTPFAMDEMLVFNGMDSRGVYDDSDENKGKLWQVPRLAGDHTGLFGSTNTAKLTMVITLKYLQKGGGGNAVISEYIDCSVEVTLVRDLEIKQEDSKKVVIDGTAINLSEHFSAEGVTESKFINDTLEVLVPANTSIENAYFTMSLTRGEELIKENIEVKCENIGPSYAKTAYISLSEKFGINVQEGDVVTITDSKNVTLYYITNQSTVGNITDDTFTVSTISNDYIYIENADLIDNKSHYYNVTKHYIMNCRIEGLIFPYRVSREYCVTPICYQMIQSFDVVGFVLEDSDSDGKISYSEWNGEGQSFLVYGAKYENGKVVIGSKKTSDLSFKLKFKIAEEENSYAGLTIGNAEIDADGTITLGSGFNQGQYIKVDVSTIVSGPDRNIGPSDDATYIKLGTLNLALVRAGS